MVICLVIGAQGARSEGMVGVGVRRMVMRVIVLMAVLVPVVMAVLVALAVRVLMAVGRDRLAVGLAGAGAFALAQVAAIGEALHVVVVAVLGGAHLGFKAEHLGAVFAEGAVHVGVAAHHLLHALHEGVEHQWVIRQIGRLEEFQLRVIRRHPVGVLEDPAHQHA